MNPIRKLAGQTAIYGIPSIVGRFVNYLLVPLYTYGLLTQQEYGVVNLFYSYIALLMVILTYGMETAFFRFSETEKDKGLVYSTGLISLITTSLLFVTLTTIFSGRVAGWIDYGNQSHYVVWFACIMALDAMAAIPFARLRALNRPVRFAVIKLTNIVVYVSFNLFFLLLCPFLFGKLHGTMGETMLRLVYRPDWVIEYIFIANLLASITTLIMLIPYIRGLAWRLDPALLKRMLIYGLPLMVAGLAGIINETVDRILLRYLLPMTPAAAEAQVGVYSACYKIAVLMVLFIQAYRFAAEPFFFSQMKHQDARQMYARVMDYFIVAVTTIFLVSMLFLDTVFIRFTGPEFRSARAVIPVLMLAKLFLGIYFNLSIWFKLTGKTLWGALITIIGATITIGLNFWLIPLPDSYMIHGYLGSAYATLACYTTMMIIGYLLGQKYFPIPYNLKKFFGYTGLALLLYGISAQVKPTYWIISIIFNTFLLGVFLVIVWLTERKKAAIPV
jgi:O-antigen/teichoic acid export membrane protein